MSVVNFPLSIVMIDWRQVRRVLVVRLRSIGDTVLATPSLIALRRFLPDTKIDILLEDWIAPLIENFEPLDRVVTVGRSFGSRLNAVREIRRQHYEVAFNLHGGTTATFFTYASGARHRVGYREYQYSFLYNHLLSSSADFWRRSPTHSAEQQLALLGFVGVPVADLPKTNLAVSAFSLESVERKFFEATQTPLDQVDKLALIHPAAAFDTKRWAAENFARVAEYLGKNDFNVVAVAAASERAILDELRRHSTADITTFDDLSLDQITALASRADLFVGNDSGIAHIAAAVRTPSVVIFGSSNIDHWRPWTDAPNEIVAEAYPCRPCAGYRCLEFSEPRCIQTVKVEAVIHAIEKVIAQNEKRRAAVQPAI
ncbi:MAG: glycosyltransferase family 9 protein [Acidobacteria bacterium]|nr:glycosyltransferase family 9 protein [Acidobacteriota bacterium]